VVDESRRLAVLFGDVFEKSRKKQKVGVKLHMSTGRTKPSVNALNTKTWIFERHSRSIYCGTRSRASCTDALARHACILSSQILNVCKHCKQPYQVVGMENVPRYRVWGSCKEQKPLMQISNMCFSRLTQPFACPYRLRCLTGQQDLLSSSLAHLSCL
jgi:hypothetical protein